MAKITRLDNETVEKLIIAYELSNPKYFRVLDSSLFAYSTPRRTQECMNAFYHKFNTHPTVESIKSFAEEPDVQFFVIDVSSMNTADDGVFRLTLEELHDMAANRYVLEEIKFLTEGLQKNNKGRELAGHAIRTFSSLPRPRDNEEIRRGFAHDPKYLQKQWEDYKARHADPDRFRDGVPYGITALDRLTTGGTRPGHLTLVYSETSGGKTRFKVNVAYNMAQLGYRVLYISIEDPFDEIARMWYSRASRLDFSKIAMAQLNADDQHLYYQTLNQIAAEKKLPYLAFWPGDGTVEDVKREVRNYEAITGFLPQVIFIDYANEMYPVNDKWNTTSERFNYLFSDFRKYAAENRISLMTSMQQSRTGQQKKKEEDFDISDIGQSHYVAPHCHVVIFLKQKPEDRDANILRLYIKKNRYGKKDEVIPVSCYWNINYVGDRNPIKPHEYIKHMMSASYDGAENDAQYSLAPVNAPDSSSLDPGELLETDDGSQETLPEG